MLTYEYAKNFRTAIYIKLVNDCILLEKLSKGPTSARYFPELLKNQIQIFICVLSKWAFIQKFQTWSLHIIVALLLYIYSKSSLVFTFIKPSLVFGYFNDFLG